MLLGPALAPLAGGMIPPPSTFAALMNSRLGVAAHYASWRVMQYILALAAAIDFVMMYFLFPETSHPGTRGIDKREFAEERAKGMKYKILNPFASLRLLRSPNLLAIVS